MRRLFRRIERVRWLCRKWWMFRQIPRPQAEIIRERDAAKRAHKKYSHFDRQLQAHVHQDLRS